MGKFFKRRASDAPRESGAKAERRQVAPEAATTSEALPAETFHSVPEASAPKTQTPPPADTPSVFAFMGASGGVGTTTLCTQFAYDLALRSRDSRVSKRHARDPKVCLIDLDFEAGACAHHLDLLPSLSLEDLTTDARRIDTAFTAALVSTHDCGLSLLAVPNTPAANSQINPRAVMAMLDAAAQLYDYVIIDVPRYLQPWSWAVLGGADFVGVVSELTIPSLHMGREHLGRMDTALGGNLNAHPIIGKYERRSFRNMLRLSDAETALAREVYGALSWESDVTREALNCGEPVGAIRAESRYAKDVRKLSDKLLRSAAKQSKNPAQAGKIKAA